MGSNLNPLDQSDEIYLLKNFQDNMLDNIVLRGIKNINKVLLRKDPNVVKYSDGTVEVGDLIGYRPRTESEFIVDGKRLYRVLSNLITIKYGN